MAGYKKFADFHRGTSLVGSEYFELRSKERKERRLPTQFYKEVYVQMYDWLQHKPSIRVVILGVRRLTGMRSGQAVLPTTPGANLAY
jgi:hypothetical protein